MHPLKKRHIMETFSLDNWVDLKDRESKHTIFDFKGCLQNKNWKDALAMLPVRVFLHQEKGKKSPVNRKTSLTRSILNKLNNNFPNNYHATVTNQVKKFLIYPSQGLLRNQLKIILKMNGKKLCKVIFTPGTINIDNIITSTS